ncbi:glycyl-tRNA synthetase subunit beta [Pelagibacteraceae bacterium GOM-A1]|nr:glycyl-tRNA synthetase subunit beta [Pelagibacteraceae bacterium GOM-A1]
MSEFFLELFSEEIPSRLQINARNDLIQIFKKFFDDNEITVKGKINTYSTPNRLIVHINKISKDVIKKAEEIRGPNINAPEKALEGFLKSNKINKEKVFKKSTEKGIFYFYNKPSQKIKTYDLLKENIASLLLKISWKKKMKWGNHNLYWGRPLKSILALFDKKIIEFKLNHLQSSNKTFTDKDLEDEVKSFYDFKSYIKFFKQKGVTIDQNKRKKFIIKEINKATTQKKIHIDLNEKLIDEIINIVEKPKVLVCEFNKKFLEIPQEILIITMQHHQKYFPTFDSKNKITSNFIVVADCKDKKGLVKLGNQNVVDARLADAEFFWNRNKSQNLVKQVSRLKQINYFKGLGSYFDKIQRVRKLSGIISDELLISKEKIEIASSICKVDLMSDLVGEFPELQGVMGGYFAREQGFDEEISLAVSEHYLPSGIDSKVPKKPYSIALSLSDKIDSLVGFFGINLKPTSSKDPYALRRMAISLLRLIIENQKKIKLRDLINYSINLYKDQNYSFDSKLINDELGDFILDRLKNYLKEKNIRSDIIECSTNSYGIDDLLKIFNKSLNLNKNIKKDFGLDVIAIYKRSANILNSESKSKLEIVGSADPGLFKNDYEKNLYKKIHNIRKYFSSIGIDEDYDESLKTLSSAKIEVNEFFDNVIVNDQEEIIKKNRLELLKMLCKSFDNYFNFSKIEA